MSNDGIERFAFFARCPECEIKPNNSYGEWVRYSDHERIVKGLELELNEWRTSNTAAILKRHADELGSERERRTAAQDALRPLHAELEKLCAQPSLSDALKEVEKARGEWAHLAEVAVDDVGETHWRAQIQAADKLIKRLKSLSPQKERIEDGK